MRERRFRGILACRTTLAHGLRQASMAEAQPSVESGHGVPEAQSPTFRNVTPLRRAKSSGQPRSGRPSITPRETKSSRLRASLGSGGSPLSVTSAAPRSSSATPEVISGGMVFETTRLRDELRASQREADKQAQEICTLKSALGSKEQALKAAAASAQALTERVLNAEGGLTSRTKELSSMTAERNQYRSEAAEAGRQADKLTQRLSAMPKGSGFSEVVAGLEAELKSMKADHEKLAKDNKGCCNQIRAKDKQLSAAGVQLEHARAILVENKELQNSILDQTRRLQEAADDKATQQIVQRQLRAELARAQDVTAAAEEEAAQKGRELACMATALKVSQEREAQLTTELALLNAELSRIRPVAARATTREIGNGTKDEGIVPMTMHLEEVRYLQGQSARLQEKLALAERSASATLAQKEALHKKLDALQAKISHPKPGTDSSQALASCEH
ncbi:g811 [Coccomyxa viridis]|uniref:G811 protein n=1 Tax=Coccomyxa viridis TaxID=1274662 RepID=A0ABP1FJI9_9CHLO